MAAAGLAHHRPAPGRIAHRLVRRPLDSGLTLVLDPDPDLGFVVVSVWHRVGSGDDPPDGSGLAHLVEHVTADPVGSGADELPAPAATTSLERTTYVESGPPSSLPDLLGRAARRMAAAREPVAEGVADLHRRAVVNEIGQRESTARFGSGARRGLALLFGPGHPWSRPALGVPEHVRRLSADDVAGFVRTHGHAGAVVVAVVGSFEVAEAQREAERCFAALPPGAVGAGTPLPAAAAVRGREDVEEGQPTGLLRCQWTLPRSDAPLHAAGEVTMRYLAGGAWSALHRPLVVTGRALGAVGFHASGGRGESIAVLKVSVPADVPLGEAEAEVRQQIARLAVSGPDEDMLAAARATQAKRWLGVLSSARGRAEELCRHEDWHGDATTIDDRLADLHSVTGDQLAEVARHWLGDPAVVAHHAAGNELDDGWIP